MLELTAAGVWCGLEGGGHARAGRRHDDGSHDDGALAALSAALVDALPARGGGVKLPVVVSASDVAALMALMTPPPSIPPSLESKSESERESAKHGYSSVVSEGSSAASAWAAAALAACAEASEHNRAAVVRAGGGAALAAAMAEGGRELRVAAARAAAALAHNGDGGFMATEARSANAALWVEGLTRVIADALPATVRAATVGADSGTLTLPTARFSLLLR